jgi:hypothetical protein
MGGGASSSKRFDMRDENLYHLSSSEKYSIGMKSGEDLEIAPNRYCQLGNGAEQYAKIAS